MANGKTIWLFRELLVRAKAIEALFDRFDEHLRGHGYLAMSGQIVDTASIAAPTQRNSDPEKDMLKAAANDGRQLADQIVPESTASPLWVHTAYRCKHNEELLAPRASAPKSISTNRAASRCPRPSPRPRSAWPNSPTTCAVFYGARGEPRRHDAKEPNRSSEPIKST